MSASDTFDSETAPTVASLRSIRIFSDLDDGRLERIAKVSWLECQAVGSVVLREQEPADLIRGVVDGRIAIELSVPGQRGVAVSTASQGDIIGWSALLPQSRWVATARTLKNTTMVAVPGAELLALCEEDHELGYHVMHHTFEAVAQRLHDTWLQRLDSFSR